MQIAPAPRKPRTALGRTGMIAALVSLSLVAGSATWAFLTEIGSAVVATGAVSVAGKPKSIQHLDGGIVQEILVSDGDLVEAGQVLMRLDPNLLTANLEIYLNRLSELVTREARLRRQIGRYSKTEPPPPVEVDAVMEGQGRAESAFGLHVDSKSCLAVGEERFQLRIAFETFRHIAHCRARGMTPVRASSG